ncbi:hypothetical protein [Streptomyces sp. TRM49041]|uniref:hypothetical protein n=1 Tax=Streptomyces sp. TRM49041 TaxID=2603216 RepID=UPI0011EF9C44|nr:hypothetical protein [Streptomyces sp. TRM49041]
MALSTDERDLLQMIADSPKPVAMSDYFPVLNPAEPGMDENHPGHEAWTERQIAWHGVSLQLWKQNLVRVVVPANGSHGDLVEVTDTGRQALRVPEAHA